MTTLTDLQNLIESMEREKQTQDATVERLYEALAAIDPDAGVGISESSLPDVEWSPRSSENAIAAGALFRA